jgi:hypothetical protein
MKMCRVLCSIVAWTFLAISQPLAKAQALSDSSTSSRSQTETVTVHGSAHPVSSKPADMDLGLEYRRPSEREKVRNYAFDSFGPYAFMGSAFSAGIAQGETASHAQILASRRIGDRAGIRMALDLGATLGSTWSRRLHVIPWPRFFVRTRSFIAVNVPVSFPD